MCVMCHRDRQRSVNMTPEQIARRRKQRLVVNLTPEQIARERQRKRKQERKRYRIDPLFRVNRNMRTRFSRALKGRQKEARTLSITGLKSWDEVMLWLEGQFQPGMPRDNYGEVWSLDHRIPLSFGYGKDESWRRFLWHYTNLRPMFVAQNWTRGNRLAFDDVK